MKRGMKRLFVAIALIMILSIAGVFAENIGLSENTEKIVKNVAEKKGIGEEKIKSIEEVDFNKLPEQIDVENIDETYLSVYEVNYGEDKPIFVLTVSDKVKEIKEESKVSMLLNFGYSGIMSGSGFLKTATEVETSLEKGYVMVHDGSITAVSTNLEVFEESSGNLEIVVYVNGERVGFGNLIGTVSSGVKRDYAVQSVDVVNFEAGDIISVLLRASSDAIAGNSTWGDVTTLVEITTAD